MLSLLSLNVRGLKNNVKRKATFLYCKEQKVNCFFLQETHSDCEDTRFWKLQWGDSAYFSHGSSHSAGVMILFYRFQGSIIDHKSDSNGHWLMVTVEIDGVKFILVCVYGYNSKALNKLFYADLCIKINQWKVTYSTDEVIIGGDFNLVPDNSVDRLPSRGHLHTLDDIFNNLASNTNLVDCWRLKNSGVRQYTWFNGANNGQCSRLDYWLIPFNWMDNISKCEISSAPLTDHCSVTLILTINNNKRPQNIIWKFNSKLLFNNNFCDEVKNLIVEVTSLDSSPLNKWEWFKFKVKEAAIKIGKFSSNQLRVKQMEIVTNINTLCSKAVLSSEEKALLENLKNQLDNLYLDKARGAFIRSRARWIEEGEKNSSYFFNLERQRQAKKKISKLSINGVVTEDLELINKEVRDFYSNLYCSRYSEASCKSFFQSIQGWIDLIKDDFKSIMEDDLIIEELDKAINQMAKGKSPGLDGLTVDFYVFFWKDIRQLLFEALGECILRHNLSPTMKRGLITLIPKADKDPSFIENWRPITLLCTDYKLLAHVYANRLNSGLTNVISECQSAFIKGRNIHFHSRLILDMLDYSHLLEKESLILFLDFYKAFDSLEHCFIIEVLKSLGFGDKFCNIIKMFYSDISSSVSLGSEITPSFKMSRGIRQGCPISPKLFILTTQMLTLAIVNDLNLQGIKIFDKEFKISQFADDTAIFLKDKSMVDIALKLINTFSVASGLSLNINKCVLLPIHSCPESSIASINVQTEVKYLGLTISKSVRRIEEINIEKRIAEMKKSLSHWLTRDLTVFGRVILSKADGVSKLIYPCHSLFISDRNIRKANSIIFQFLWRNKTHYLKRSQLVKEYINGGLKALDFEALIGSFRIKWLKTFFAYSNSMWFHIPRAIFGKLGGIDFLLRCDFHINKIPLALSKFHSQILHFWKMIFTHNFTPHSSVLWNNRTILINRKSLFKADWFDKGILFVTDLMDCKGILLDYTSFVERFNINCTLREFQRICKAIPIALIQLIQNTLTYSDVTPVLPNLVIGHHNLVDKKFNNRIVTDAFKSKLFYDYNKNNVLVNSFYMREKAFSKYVKWPIPPKVKETHFKICHKIYPVSNFLHKRFKFDKAGCAFCDFTDESLEHLFFTCSISCRFWSDVRNWLNLKMSNIPVFNINHILFYVDGLDNSISDIVNIVFLLAKYHIHCCKWKDSRPCFEHFMNEFKIFYSSLRLLKNGCALKISSDMSVFLVL